MKRLPTYLALGVGVLLLASGSQTAEAGDSKFRLTFGKKDRRETVSRHRHREVTRHDRRGRRAHRVDVRGHRHGRSHRHNVCSCRPTRVPGYYRTVCDTVVDPGCYESVWVPPRYRTVRIGCEYRQVLACAGHYKKVWRPGTSRRVTRKVWVPAEFTVKHRCGRRFG